MAPSLHTRHYGTLPDGHSVEAHRLHGAGGLQAEILSYGGIVTRLWAPDRAGQLANTVLGYENLTGYLAGQSYYGAIIGRVAGRINNAHFTLEGTVHHLAANEAPHHLHGGVRGFDKVLWACEPVIRPDGAPSLRLSRPSPDGEEGYPGNVTVALTYTVTDDNSLRIDTEATTDRVTPFSLTHHSYFNLAGNGSAAGHTLQIMADHYAPTDEHMSLLGRREPVTPANDFRSARRLADAIPRLFRQHGDLYFLPPANAPLPVVARLADPASGRALTVHTTEACLQLYVGTALNATQAGVCLECQGYPDGANTPARGDILLRPGQPLRQTTLYVFTTF